MTPQRLLISTIKPPNYNHAAAYDEVYETVALGLQRLGFDVQRVVNAISAEVPTVLFGSHLLTAEILEQLPNTVILYNLEQVDPGTTWLNSALAKSMTSHEVWDFSQTNVHRLSAAGIATNIIWVPIGFSPELTRIESSGEDIDVLFYGSLNPRRNAILEALRARGLNVVHAFGVYGAERDNLVARAKIVLNVHFYESGILEWGRVFYSLANRKVMVSEDSIVTTFEQGIEDVVHFAPYAQVVDKCVRLVADPAERNRLLDNIPSFIERRSEEAILRSMLPHSSLGRYLQLRQ